MVLGLCAELLVVGYLVVALFCGFWVIGLSCVGVRFVVVAQLWVLGWFPG